MTTATAIKGGASAPLTTDLRASWTQALEAYQLTRILMEADSAFGPFDQANNAWDLECERLEREFGSIAKAKLSADGKARFERAWARLRAAEDCNSETVLAPMWEASRVLAATPAPDFEALKIKLAMIKEEELWNDSPMDEYGDCFEIIKADVARLRGEA